MFFHTLLSAEFFQPFI